ncbi:MAG: aldose epimerase family protein [Akkermansiaceae bacterium]|jgi:aldose 1-epimerase|tara:strand:- start:7963 stop:9024 length:1062 start_codon:yes stop_codon:yes gene_type:complete
MPTSTIDTHGEINGQTVRIFTLINASGMQVRISELGAHLISVTIPDENGQPQELTVRHDSFEGWANNSAAYLGACVGRFGNRIAHGEFTIDGKQYTLATNNDPAGIPCHLHGGPQGFHAKIWQGKVLSEEKRQGVRLTLHSPDGEEGYPGNLDVTVTYWLNDSSDANELSWHATATTDKATPINLINHTYWNLSGNLSSSITDHQIQIHADYFLPTNEGLIPTGEIRSVGDTPMDFTRPQLIGGNIESDYEPIQLAGGYDHCWVLHDHHDGNTDVHPAVVVHHPGSGRTLEVLTNQPGVQFYTGNFLSAPFPRRSGLCLETQGFPDAPNHPNFPSAILQPGETYQHKLTWRFR